MKQIRTFVLVPFLLFMIAACGNRIGGTSANHDSSSSSSNSSIFVSGPNVLPMTVGACGTNTYINEPCVSVTICTPGTQNCQTIDNILLDTGSFGLRIFSSLITVGLNQEKDTEGNSVGECAQFGSANTWGPVKTADVVLGGEQAVTVPLQVMDSTFASVPTNCKSPAPEAGPDTAGFNGILGVGLFNQDCGPGCANNSNNGLYFACSGSTCTGLAAALSLQVSNPVARLPVDNNGVILKLPSIPEGGESTVNGYVVLGIGTESNNVPGLVTMFPANSQANFDTVFDGSTFSTSFIDSGSNAIYLPGDSVLSTCPASGEASGFYCPSSTTSLVATNRGSMGSSSGVVTFSVMNAQTVFNQGFGAYDDLAGSDSGSGFGFDWGLPFFFGRSVYVGLEGTTSNLGTGPYWAY